MRALAAFALLTAATISSIPTPVQATATRAIVRWDLNEKSATHTDAIGGLVATSGTDVVNGDVYRQATGINIPSTTTDRRLHEVMPQRLTTAPSNTKLQPGTGEWAVEVRAAWTHSYGNLIQKGQNGTKGGYWKIELPSGHVTCLFKDGAGTQRAVKSTGTYNDGLWHVIRCERRADRIVLSVDGTVVKQLVTTFPAAIANTKNLSIAGKSSCDQVTVTCDYYDGRIDSITIYGP